MHSLDLCGRRIDKPKTITRLVVDKLFGADKPLDKPFRFGFLAYEIFVLVRLDNQVPAIGRPVACGHQGNFAQRVFAAFHKDVWRIHQVGVDVLCRYCFTIGQEYPLGGSYRSRRSLQGDSGKTDNHAVDMGLLFGFAIPAEGAVGKVYLQVEPFEQGFPNACHLLSLRDAIR